MNTMKLDTSPGKLTAAVAIAVLAGGISDTLGFPALAAAILVLALYFVSIISYRGTTIGQWLSRRRHVSDPYQPVHLNSQDTAGIVWDDETATVYIELLPKRPFTVSYISPSGEVSMQHIDLDLLKRMMVQNDIVLSSLSVISSSYRTVLPRHNAGGVVSSVVGNTPVPIGGRTILAIKLDTAASAAAINARAIKDSVPYGIHRSVLAAASRIRILIEGQDLSANVLSQAQVYDLSKSMNAQVGTAADHASWSRLGEGDAAKVVTYTPTGRLNRDEQVAWLQTPAFRTFEISQLSRDSSGSTSHSYAVTFVVSDENRALASVPSYGGMRRTNGQHKQAVSRLIPLVADQEVHLPLRQVSERTPALVRHYPGGLGTYIGHSQNKGKVFLRIDGGTGESMHLVGPDGLTQMILLRLSAEQVTVDVRITEASRAEQWQRFVAQLRSPLITYNSTRSPDVVVVPDGRQDAFTGTDQTVMIVGSRTPVGLPRTSIVARGQELVLTSGSEQVTVPWTLTSQEESFIVA